MTAFPKSTASRHKLFRVYPNISAIGSYSDSASAIASPSRFKGLEEGSFFFVRGFYPDKGLATSRYRFSDIWQTKQRWCFAILLVSDSC